MKEQKEEDLFDIGEHMTDELDRVDDSFDDLFFGSKRK